MGRDDLSVEQVENVVKKVAFAVENKLLERHAATIKALASSPSFEAVITAATIAGLGMMAASLIAAIIMGIELEQARVTVLTEQVMERVA